MTAPTDEKLLAYFANRQQQRDADVERFLASLTRRERWLIHEAAVMGWVLGARSVPGGHRAEIPKDSKIVGSVVAHCQSTSDLYPVIGDDVHELIRKIARQHRAPLGAVAEVVAALTAREIDDVAAVIGGMIADEELFVTDDGLRVTS